MDIKQATRLAYYLMKKHKLKGWNLIFKLYIDGSISIAGRCSHKINGRKVKIIVLSEHVISRLDESVVKKVILHEIAHALVGPTFLDDHGETWQKKCIKIGADPYPDIPVVGF